MTRCMSSLPPPSALVSAGCSTRLSTPPFNGCAMSFIVRPEAATYALGGLIMRLIVAAQGPNRSSAGQLVQNAKCRRRQPGEPSRSWRLCPSAHAPPQPPPARPGTCARPPCAVPRIRRPASMISSTRDPARAPTAFAAQPAQHPVDGALPVTVKGARARSLISTLPALARSCRMTRRAAATPRRAPTWARSPAHRRQVQATAPFPCALPLLP